MQLQKGVYYVTLKDGKVIPLQFTTWVFRKFANSKGQTLDEMVTNFGTGLISFDDILDLMLIGAEYAYLKTNVGKAFPYTAMDVSDWFDELGGVTSEKAKDLAAVIIGSLANTDPSEVKKRLQPATEEKKSE